MKNFALLLFLLCLVYDVSADPMGQTPPNCPALDLVTEQKFDLTQLNGKVVLIDFWATWCPPCKKSMPFLNALRNQYLSKGFEILAINVDENTADARGFLSSNPVDYLMTFDTTGECPAAYTVKAMPSSYLIGKDGKIRKVFLGFRDEEKSIIEADVLKLLNE